MTTVGKLGSLAALYLLCCVGCSRETGPARPSGLSYRAGGGATEVREFLVSFLDSARTMPSPYSQGYYVLREDHPIRRFIPAAMFYRFLPGAPEVVTVFGLGRCKSYKIERLDVLDSVTAQAVVRIETDPADPVPMFGPTSSCRIEIRSYPGGTHWIVGIAGLDPILAPGSAPAPREALSAGEVQQCMKDCERAIMTPGKVMNVVGWPGVEGTFDAVLAAAPQRLDAIVDLCLEGGYAQMADAASDPEEASDYFEHAQMYDPKGFLARRDEVGAKLVAAAAERLLREPPNCLFRYASELAPCLVAYGNLDKKGLMIEGGERRDWHINPQQYLAVARRNLGKPGAAHTEGLFAALFVRKWCKTDADQSYVRQGQDLIAQYQKRAPRAQGALP